MARATAAAEHRPGQYHGQPSQQHPERNTDLSPVEKLQRVRRADHLGDYNLVGAAPGCVLAGTTTTIPAAAPMLGRWQATAAPQRFFKPMAGSPAIDGGNPAGCKDQNGANLTRDQRKLQRPLDGNSDGAAVCDIGAVEAGFFTAMLPASPGRFT
jgi:hypothetical protein